MQYLKNTLSVISTLHLRIILQIVSSFKSFESRQEDFLFPNSISNQILNVKALASILSPLDLSF